MNYTNTVKQLLSEALHLANHRKHAQVEPVHILYSVLTKGGAVIDFLVTHVGADRGALERLLAAQLDQLPPQSQLQEARWSEASAHYLASADHYRRQTNDQVVTVEHLLLAPFGLKHPVKDWLIGAGFSEKKIEQAIQALRKGKQALSADAENNYQALKTYGKNLNNLAKKGKIDPVIGRDLEIRRVLQILARRTKNNPILLGPPGVGKTAIAEGIAQKIVAGDVPEHMRDKEIIALDLGLLIAGASYKGAFEERLKQVVQEVVDSNGRVILFMDEIHTLVGAGSSGTGAMDAANLLKPGLARGELRTIGATTLAEYQAYLEKDKALARRFQPVQVTEPSISDTISILRGIKERYEIHHQVPIKDEALVAAAHLSSRYLTDRYLPDKAIDLVDEAAAKMQLEKGAVPEALEALERQIVQLEIEKRAMAREKQTPRLQEIKAQLAPLLEERAQQKARWEMEKKRDQAIQSARTEIDQLRQAAETARRELNYAKAAEIEYGTLAEAQKKLKAAQAKRSANQSMTHQVSATHIAEIVARWTGIPVQKMLDSEKKKWLQLEALLQKEVAGQQEAINSLAQVVRRSRAGLQDPNRPLGSFLFLGPTGVGKTALAKALATILFNSSKALITLDLSEFQQPHSVSRLIGAPPGYVGYEAGGQLTEAIRNKPYAVLLLDELDKAHPDVLNLLLQLLEEGRLTDSKGRVVSFKNSLVIMTSNFAAEQIQAGFSNTHQPKGVVLKRVKRAVESALAAKLRPEFLNRIDRTILFHPLNKHVMQAVAGIHLKKLQKELKEKGFQISFTPAVQEMVALEGYDPLYGARPLKRVLQTRILDPLALKILKDEIKSGQRLLVCLDATKQISIKTTA